MREIAGELAAANYQISPIKTQVRELQLSLAQANAKLQAQEQIGERLRAYLDKIAVMPISMPEKPLLRDGV